MDQWSIGVGPRRDSDELARGGSPASRWKQQSCAPSGRMGVHARGPGAARPCRAWPGCHRLPRPAGQQVDATELLAACALEAAALGAPDRAAPAVGVRPAGGRRRTARRRGSRCHIPIVLPRKRRLMTASRWTFPLLSGSCDSMSASACGSEADYSWHRGDGNRHARGHTRGLSKGIPGTGS